MLPVGLFVAVLVLAACVFGASRGRRAAGLVVVACAIPLPWWSDPAWPVARAFLALGVILAVLRSIDLVRMRDRGWGPARRFAHIVSLVDTRRLVRRAPRFEFGSLAAALGWAAAVAGGVVIVTRVAPTRHGAEFWLLRWSGALVVIYAGADAAQALAHALYAAVGFESPPMHRTPAMARSIKEFWGERWNLAVSLWLREHAMRPLVARAGVSTGVAAAFAASAVVHAYLATAAAGWRMGLLMGGFFVVQGLWVILELRVGVARWAPWVARCWSIGLMVAVSPMFLEPLLRGVGLR